VATDFSATIFQSGNALRSDLASAAPHSTSTIGPETSNTFAPARATDWSARSVLTAPGPL